MRDFASAAWQTCEQMHLLMLDDDQPENEKQRLDPDHWYEINLTNAMLFANLTLDGLPQLVPGRLFSTRMPRNIVKDPNERLDFIKKCRKNDLRVREFLILIKITIWVIYFLFSAFVFWQKQKSLKSTPEWKVFWISTEKNVDWLSMYV